MYILHTFHRVQGNSMEGGGVRFYNGRGTAEQWIKEGKYALNWTRLSCHRFVANRVRLSLFILAYNLDSLVKTRFEEVPAL